MDDHPDPSASTIKQVAIFGYADTKEDDPLYKTVQQVTRKLAENGYVVVDGGGPGLMRAATQGAKAVNGRVIGVTFYPTDLPHFEGRDSENHIDEEIKTSSYVERTLTLMSEGQVYVIFKGGTGTISEFGMAWGLARLHFGHHKPLILYGDFWKKIITAFEENMLLRPEEKEVYKIVSSPEEVLEAIKQFEVELKTGAHQHLAATREKR
ncbi:LOG family protein [Patescibacteria group bacterium]|nr:LOG family protein [Patescibacteria group bacterium]MCL5409881.1 LOG family protein [Patescibacteria group bacterium]